MEVGDQHHALVPFSLGKSPSTLCTECWWTKGLVWVGLDERKYLVSTWVMNESGLHKFLQKMVDG